MRFKSNFKVIAPIVLSDLGCGLDTFGLALDGLYDEVLVKPNNSPGIHINEVVGNKTNIPLEYAQNAAGAAAQATLSYLQQHHDLDPQLGLTLTIRKRIPVGHGLGSSAASAVVGAMAINEAFGRPLSKRELLPFAVQGEAVVEGLQRINAVVPALLGGCFLIQDHVQLRYHRLPFLKGLKVVFIYPRNIQMFQQERRQLLPPQQPMATWVQQSANAAALVQALYMGNLDGIQAALAFQPLERYWKDAIPQFDHLKSTALELGALGCSIAGKGSAVFALCKNSLDAEEIGAALSTIYEQERIRHTLVQAGIDLEGAIIA